MMIATTNQSYGYPNCVFDGNVTLSMSPSDGRVLARVGGAEFTCTSKAAGGAIEWYRGDGLLIQQIPRYQTTSVPRATEKSLTAGMLFIADPQFNDTGSYFCQDKKIASCSLMVRLYVLGGLNFVEKQADVIAYPRATIELTTLIQVNGPVLVQVEWRKFGEKAICSTITHVNGEMNFQCRLSSVNKETGGVYEVTITSTTTNERISSSFSIIVVESPKILNLSCKASATSIELHWVVEKSGQSHPLLTVVAYSPNNATAKVLNATAGHVVLPNLKPGCSYSISITLYAAGQQSQLPMPVLAATNVSCTTSSTEESFFVNDENNLVYFKHGNESGPVCFDFGSRGILKQLESSKWLCSLLFSLPRISIQTGKTFYVVKLTAPHTAPRHLKSITTVLCQPNLESCDNGRTLNFSNICKEARKPDHKEEAYQNQDLAIGLGVACGIFVILLVLASGFCYGQKEKERKFHSYFNEMSTTAKTINLKLDIMSKRIDSCQENNAQLKQAVEEIKSGLTKVNVSKTLASIKALEDKVAVLSTQQSMQQPEKLIDPIVRELRNEVEKLRKSISGLDEKSITWLFQTTANVLWKVKELEKINFAQFGKNLNLRYQNRQPEGVSDCDLSHLLQSFRRELSVYDDRTEQRKMFADFIEWVCLQIPYGFRMALVDEPLPITSSVRKMYGERSNEKDEHINKVFLAFIEKMSSFVPTMQEENFV